uniref:Uncharacterized protein n=1 Tax=Strigamia maritima TaxID=126957 RepID=T1JM34_STRMM
MHHLPVMRKMEKQTLVTAFHLIMKIIFKVFLSSFRKEHYIMGLYASTFLIACAAAAAALQQVKILLTQQCLLYIGEGLGSIRDSAAVQEVCKKIDDSCV